MANLSFVEILGIGAEAIIIREGDKVIKRRIEKKYRIKVLDEKLRKERTKYEARIMEKARRIGIEVPKIYEVKDFEIVMEYIDGERISDILEKIDYIWVARDIGKKVALLHKHGIVHGDLTTSNFILKGDKIYLIDFGLSEYSSRIEDFAVDLLLLKRAILSKHPKIFENFWKAFVEEYSKNFEKSSEVLRRLEEIEKRGRYVKRK